MNPAMLFRFTSLTLFIVPLRIGVIVVGWTVKVNKRLLNTNHIGSSEVKAALSIRLNNSQNRYCRMELTVIAPACDANSTHEA
jgi:hypothetical protein